MGPKMGPKNKSQNRVKKSDQKRVPKNGPKKMGPKNGSKKMGPKKWAHKNESKKLGQNVLLLIISSYFLGSSPFHSNNGPKSLPAGQQIPESNGPMSLHNNNTNWNPCEDMKNTYSAISAKFFISLKGFQLVLLFCKDMGSFDLGI